MRTRRRIGELIALPSGSAHVRQDGPADGEAIVLIHGFASSMHSFDRLTALLSDKYRVIRADLLGHGCTGGDGGTDGLGADSQAAMLAAVLDELGVERTAVLGHSFGADVALALAERSKHVERLVVVGQAPDYSYAKLPAGGSVLALPVVGALLHRLTTPQVIRIVGRFAFAPGFDPGAAFDERGRPYRDHAAMSPAMYRTVLGDRRRWMEQRPLDARVRELGLPTLAIAGRHDQLYDCDKTVARYRDAGAITVVVEGAGHSPPIERPAQVAELIEDFLSDRLRGDR